MALERLRIISAYKVYIASLFAKSQGVSAYGAPFFLPSSNAGFPLRVIFCSDGLVWLRVYEIASVCGRSLRGVL